MADQTGDDPILFRDKSGVDKRELRASGYICGLFVPGSHSCL